MASPDAASRAYQSDLSLGDETEMSAMDFLSFPEAALSIAHERLPELDLDAMKAVLLLHRVTSAVVYDLESSVHRPAGWSWASFRLLSTLWISGKLESKRAADLAGMSRAAVSSLTKTLEAAGLVAKEEDPMDRRSVILGLTARGVERFEETFREHNKRESSWMGRLSPEDRDSLIRILVELNHTARSQWVKRRA